jgi:hypothetical protein
MGYKVVLHYFTAFFGYICFLFNRPRESGENIINCHPVEGSPNKPKNLIAMEAESLKLRHQKITVSNYYFNY